MSARSSRYAFNACHLRWLVPYQHGRRRNFQFRGWDSSTLSATWARGEPPHGGSQSRGVSCPPLSTWAGDFHLLNEIRFYFLVVQVGVRKRQKFVCMTQAVGQNRRRYSSIKRHCIGAHFRITNAHQKRFRSFRTGLKIACPHTANQDTYGACEPQCRCRIVWDSLASCLFQPIQTSQ